MTNPIDRTRPSATDAAATLPDTMTVVVARRYGGPEQLTVEKGGAASSAR